MALRSVVALVAAYRTLSEDEKKVFRSEIKPKPRKKRRRKAKTAKAKETKARAAKTEAPKTEARGPIARKRRVKKTGGKRKTRRPPIKTVDEDVADEASKFTEGLEPADPLRDIVEE